MLGVVLCGGKSTRMGSDKGLLRLHAKTWAQTAVDKMNALQVPVVLSVNKNQYQEYSAIFDQKQLVVDDVLLHMHGPLSGVLSVHLRYPGDDLIILGCDMPLMETELLKELVTCYHQNPAKEAFVFANDEEPEPLCAVYKASGLHQILSLHQSNQLPKHSMKYMLDHISTHFIPLTDDKKKCFRNFNAHAELNGL